MNAEIIFKNSITPMVHTPADPSKIECMKFQCVECGGNINLARLKNEGPILLVEMQVHQCST